MYFARLLSLKKIFFRLKTDKIWKEDFSFLGALKTNLLASF